MDQRLTVRHIGVAICLGSLAGCASTGPLIESPEVSLRNVEVSDVNLKNQTFVLDFDVTNPNPFPLPIESVSYGIALDGYRFASGETRGEFTVPASSDGGFAISVDLNLMRTAPALFFIVREGVYREIPYELEGEFDLDIPLAPPIAFRAKGHIQLHAAAVSADRNQ